MHEIFVFSDESGNPLVLNKRGKRITRGDPGGPKSFYVGILITPNPYEIRKSVNNAFIDLKNNIKNNKDKRTIDRGYFHARIDSHLARITIANALSTCNFTVKISEYNKDKFPGDNDRAKKQKEFHIQQLLATLSLLTMVYRKINLIIAKRPKSMESSVIPNIIDRLKNHCKFSLIESPHLPYRDYQFDDIKVEEDMTKEPVLQAIDFALWAYCRFLNSNDNTYINCLKFNEIKKFNGSGENSYLSGYDFYVGKDVYAEAWEDADLSYNFSNIGNNEPHKILIKLKNVLENLETDTPEDKQLNDLLCVLMKNSLDGKAMYLFMELWAKRIDNWHKKMDISCDEYICIKNRGGLVIAAQKRKLSAVEQLDLTRWSDYLRKISRN
ncbi:MAG: hypothetical protein ACUZ8E_15685 [Candidatus Anammoxibacter sp.]